VLVEVTGTFGSGEVGASVPLQLEGGDVVLLENNEAVTVEQTAPVVAAAEAGAPVTGVSATGGVGTVAVTGLANVSVTGVSATGGVGTVTVTGLANVSVTGVSATGAVGTVTVTGLANVPVTGVSATGAVGTVTVTGLANVSVTGVAGVSALGDITVSAQAVVFPSEVSGTGVTGRVLVWSSVIPGSDALWLPIGRFVLLLENGDFVLQEPAAGAVVLLEASTDGATWDKIDTNTNDIWTPVAA